MLHTSLVLVSASVYHLPDPESATVLSAASIHSARKRYKPRHEPKCHHSSSYGAFLLRASLLCTSSLSTSGGSLCSIIVGWNLTKTTRTSRQRFVSDRNLQQPFETIALRKRVVIDILLWLPMESAPGVHANRLWRNGQWASCHYAYGLPSFLFNDTA